MSTNEELYNSGLSALAAITWRLSSDQWEETACGTWTASELARHVFVVANWYHQWLDRALTGDSAPPFPPSEFDAHAQDGVDAHKILTGPEAIGAAISSAESYLKRALEQDQDLPYGFGFGTSTVGLHLGGAAAEWHLHAWDFSTLAGPRHTPEDPNSLFKAAGELNADRRGGIGGAAMRIGVGLAARGDTWANLLKASGRG